MVDSRVRVAGKVVNYRDKREQSKVYSYGIYSL